jgi:hypothetical protein
MVRDVKAKAQQELAPTPRMPMGMVVAQAQEAHKRVTMAQEEVVAMELLAQTAHQAELVLEVKRQGMSN